jgi:hypothetical protein
MIDFNDFEAIALKHLHTELDTEPMTMVHPRLPAFIECSLGRMYVAHCRQVTADVASGARPPLLHDRGRFEDIMQASVAMMSDYIGTYHYELVEILDWLLLAGAENHPWLDNVDNNGLPKKLMKCQSVEALYNESVKCMRGRQPQRKSERDLTTDDERHVADLGAGYTVVELLSPEALDVESTRMRHCIGNGSYDRKLSHPGFYYFSIRDENGCPQATVELTPKLIDNQFTSVIRQFQGSRNTAPEPFLVEMFNTVVDDIMTYGVPVATSAPQPPVGRF